MKRDQTENLTDIAIKLGQFYPHRQARLLSTNLCKLAKLARSLRKRYENDCNYQWADTDEYRARTAELQKKTIELGYEIGVKVEHQQDPRGAPVCLRFNNAEYWLF